MKNEIRTLSDLKAEILVLKLKKSEHELYFKQKKEGIKKLINSPFEFLKNIKSFVGISPSHDTLNKVPKNADWATALARVAFPLFLNKTLFRGKGMIAKTLLTFLSQRVINPKNVNESKVVDVIDKVSNWINSTLKKDKKEQKMNYGIPPDSETY